MRATRLPKSRVGRPSPLNRGLVVRTSLPDWVRDAPVPCQHTPAGCTRCDPVSPGMRQRAKPLGIIIDGPGQEVRSSRVRSPDELALAPAAYKRYSPVKIALFVDRCIAPASRIF